MSICYINGEWRPVGECSLPVTDLVIQRGVGVFDSLRIYDRRAMAVSAHMTRLSDSARSAGINVADGSVIRGLTDAVREGVKRPDCPDGGNCLAKVYITGGDENAHGLFPRPRSFVILEGGPEISPDEYRTGVALQPTTERRPYPLVKSINYLFGLMQGAGRDDVLECLYCPDGRVTETLRSSFFICHDGKIITAPLGEVLGGVTRSIVLELAREDGFTVEERCPETRELATCDEAFLTSSWKEVMPVVRVGETRIANGKPGPVAAHLQKLFRENFGRWLDK
jgi:branched-chain amino acid aminotransferase